MAKLRANLNSIQNYVILSFANFSKTKIKNTKIHTYMNLTFQKYIKYNL